MIGHQISQLCENQGIKVTNLEYLIGASKGVLSRAITNKTDIQSKWVAKIIENYPQYNPTWLLTGRGDMRVKGEPATTAPIGVAEEPQAKYARLAPTVIEINPEVSKTNTLIADVKASAGLGNIEESHQALENLPAIHLPNAPLGLNIAFQIKGDSMYPTIRNMDFVVGNQITDLADIRDGHTYIIVDESQGVLCKRLYRRSSCWSIVSDNSSIYPPYDRSDDKILAFFHAFCRWSSDFQNQHANTRADIQEMKKDIEVIKGKIK